MRQGAGAGHLAVTFEGDLPAVLRESDQSAVGIESRRRWTPGIGAPTDPVAETTQREAPAELAFEQRLGVRAVQHLTTTQIQRGAGHVLVEPRAPLAERSGEFDPLTIRGVAPGERAVPRLVGQVDRQPATHLPAGRRRRARGQGFLRRGRAGHGEERQHDDTAEPDHGAMRSTARLRTSLSGWVRRASSKISRARCCSPVTHSTSPRWAAISGSWLRA